MEKIITKLSLLLVGFFVFFGTIPGYASAQRIIKASPSPSPTPIILEVATPSAQIASPAAEVIQKIEEKKDKDITETTGQAKNRLVKVLEDTPREPLSVTNFIRQSIRTAVASGVPANMLVLLLLFPVTASFVAASRHVIGMRSFGVYAPAVLSVVFLSTGIITGLAIFTIILVVATVGRSLLQYLKLQYLPRTALLVWLVSLSMFGLLLISPWLLPFGIDIITLSIFPILVLVLLSENFLEAMLLGSSSKAFGLVLETIILAVLSTVFVKTEFVQEFVILNPELTILAVFLFDLAVGKYTGLRVSEYFRFKPIIDPEE